MESTAFTSPSELRRACRDGRFSNQTSGQAPGYSQANLVILPKKYAFDFLLFCQRNPKSCPLLEVLEPGVHVTAQVAKDADIRTDLPKYRVYRDGVLTEEVTDISSLWREDLCTFIIGCSFSFEDAMLKSGLPVRHVQEGRNVPMYNTNIPCASAGIFRGNMVVSMRPFLPAQAIQAVQVTARYPRVHGSPIHIGDPTGIGIKDISLPDYGDSVSVGENEVPVFWACGVTPQAVVMDSRPEFCITHSPGYMLVLDMRNEELSFN
mmetsp:Transcript_12280/g.18608  ORF Transcript_12280/g.18608 Transcript_12280/m.18608 type:complete len:264 (-) Transcript_12280:101-892(-)